MRRWAFLLPLLAACLTWRACRADGPHWQVPDPGPLYGEDPTKVPPLRVDRGLGAGGSRNAPTDVSPNPGDFTQLDDKCVDFYQRHCAIKFKDKRQFYLDIMARCAQVMREVDDYLPCPDSYPLWHAEETRAVMVQFAQRTWLKVQEIPREFQGPCYQYMVDAYADTIRFDETAIAAKNAERKRELARIMEIQDPAERNRAFRALAKVMSPRQADLDTFVFVTGDIPPMAESAGAAVYMKQVLMKIGLPILPYLQAGLQKAKSQRVARALQELIELIRRPTQPPPKTTPPKKDVKPEPEEPRIPGL